MTKWLYAVYFVLVVVAFTAVHAENYALVIGISNYEFIKGAQSQIHYADSDADMFADFLKTPEGFSFSPKNIHILKNSEAMRTRIFSEIKSIASSVNKDDTVYVFFSGHGWRDQYGNVYYMPVDATPDLLEDRGIKADDFLRFVSHSIPALNVIIFIDACYAAVPAGVGIDANNEEDVQQAASRKESPDGKMQKESWDRAIEGDRGTRMVLGSASPTQASYEDSALQHGVFSWFLVEALKGKAGGDGKGTINAGKVYLYVSQQVRTRCLKKFNIRQVPMISAAFNWDFPLGKIILTEHSRDPSNKLRARIAKVIVNVETRRDEKGHPLKYEIPEGDERGGYGQRACEFAGIDDKNYPDMFEHLTGLLAANQYEKAESEAGDFIASLTDPAATWCATPAVEMTLRDMMFHEGPTGAVIIVQMATGVETDGSVGPQTLAALEREEKVNPRKLLAALKQARRDYELKRHGTRRIFLEGFAARYDIIYQFSLKLLEEGTHVEGKSN